MMHEIIFTTVMMVSYTKDAVTRQIFPYFISTHVWCKNCIFLFFNTFFPQLKRCRLKTHWNSWLCCALIPWEMIFKAVKFRAEMNEWKINNRPQFHFHFRLICIVNKLSRWMTWKIFQLTLKIYANSIEYKNNKSSGWGWGSGRWLNGLSLKLAEKLRETRKTICWKFLRLFVNF